MRWAWVLAALAAAACGDTWRCPAACECGGAGETLVSCGDTDYKVRDDGYIEVDCQGGVLSCSSVPSLPQQRTLRHLELVNCVVEEGAGGCVAAAAGSARGGPPVFYTRGLKNNLTEGAFEGLEGVEKLIMHDASVQHTFPPLSSLSHLTQFRIVDGDHLQLTPSLPPSLTYLEIIGSGVKSLSREVFEGLVNLETLHLYNNEIETVNYTDLAPLVSLRVLSVMFEPVRHLRVAPLASIEELTAVRVALRDLHEGDVSGMPRLRKLDIKSSAPLTLHPRALSSLPSLTSLRVSQSQVTSLPRDLFADTAALVNVSLAWNNVTDVPLALFHNMSSLQRLDLSHNSISTLLAGTFDPLASVVEISLDYNNITALPTRLFTLCSSLRSLSLSHNSLVSLPSPTFPPTLTSLRLNYNQLSGPTPPPALGGIPDEYSIGPYFPSPFNSLVELETLELSHNSISYMFPDLRQVLLNLRHLDLSYNAFRHLLRSDTEFLSMNITVDLRHNLVSRVDPYIRYIFTPDSDDGIASPSPPSQRILLSHNPFSCDCLLYPLLSNLRDTTYDLSDATCSSPSSLNGTALTHLDLDRLYCNFTGGEYPPNPDNCTCLYRPSRDRYECTCSLLAVDDLPRPYELNVKHLSLKLTRPTSIERLPEFVNELNVSGIGLTEFDYNVSTVRVIDLSDNELGEIPGKYLRGNHSLYLRGNPIRCDCWSSDFVLELHKYSNKILDYEAMSCLDGGRVSLVDPGALCHLYTATVVGSTLAVLGLVAAVLSALCWRYKTDIKGYLSTIPGLEFLEEDEPEGKEYDVFVSFSHEDFPYVRDVLLPVLDEEYRLCLHYREWQVGQPIPAQIHRSVLASRRTLVLLSRHYIESRWALAEFREAAAHGRLLLLLLEDVDRRRLPQDLTDYIASTTYLEVTDPRFWNKLRRALPRRPMKSPEKTPKRDETPAATPTSTSPLGEAPLGLSDHVALAVGLADPTKVSDAKKPAIDVILNEHGQLVNRGYVKDV